MTVVHPNSQCSFVKPSTRSTHQSHNGWTPSHDPSSSSSPSSSSRPCSASSSSITPSQSPSSSSSKNNGKRFVRRAKRWADMQNRRQGGHHHHGGNGRGRGGRGVVNTSTHTTVSSTVLSSPSSSLISSLSSPSPSSSSSNTSSSSTSEMLELRACHGRSILSEEEEKALFASHPHLAATASLPYSILIPTPITTEPSIRYRTPSTPSLNGEIKKTTVSVTNGINEYGRRTMISVYKTQPQLTIYPPRSTYSSTDESIDKLERDLHYSSLDEWCPSSDDSSSPFSSQSILSIDGGLDEDIEEDRNDSVNTMICDVDYDYLTNYEYYQPSTVSPFNFHPSPYHSAMPFFQQRFDQPVNTVPPPDRTWMMIRHADPERPIATFTVLCYNVLCDKYATQSLYSYCPSWALNWEYRKQSIIKEIRNYEADIVTLQEVETEQYKLLFQPEMKALGYNSIFSPKSRAKLMNDEEKKYVDGCAIFWKSDKFEMSSERLIEFTQVAIKKAPASEQMLNRVMPRDNIALCAVLRIKEAVYNNRNLINRVTMPPADNVVGTPLIVCTAHIHWDPEFCDVKLVQSMMLAHELWRLVEEVSSSNGILPHQCPVLVCGDLNSLPESGVFEFLSKSGISRNHPDLKAFKEDSILEKFSHTHDGSNYTHALRLDSAVEGGVVPFTNYTLDFKGMIDYIFSTPQSLARLGVLGPFDMEWTRTHKIIGFPHPHVPSDHIPIMAQYAMIPTPHQRPQPQIHHYGNQHSSSFGAVGRVFPL